MNTASLPGYNVRRPHQLLYSTCKPASATATGVRFKWQWEPVLQHFSALRAVAYTRHVAGSLHSSSFGFLILRTRSVKRVCACSVRRVLTSARSLQRMYESATSFPPRWCIRVPSNARVEWCACTRGVLLQVHVVCQGLVGCCRFTLQCFPSRTRGGRGRKPHPYRRHTAHTPPR